MRTSPEKTSTEPSVIDRDGPAPNAAVVAALGSVGLALYYYYVRGEKQRGQFIGLWPATFLGLAVYRKLDHLTRLLSEAAD